MAALIAAAALEDRRAGKDLGRIQHLDIVAGASEMLAARGGILQPAVPRVNLKCRKAAMLSDIR